MKNLIIQIAIIDSFINPLIMFRGFSNNE